MWLPSEGLKRFFGSKTMISFYGTITPQTEICKCQALTFRGFAAASKSESDSKVKRKSFTARKCFYRSNQSTIQRSEAGDKCWENSKLLLFQETQRSNGMFLTQRMRTKGERNREKKIGNFIVKRFV